MSCQETLAFKNTLGFQAPIEDLCLEWCILEDYAKNKVTGSNIALTILPMESIISTWRLIVSGL
jgi:hypothetical protein